MALIKDSEGYLHPSNGACEECQGAGTFFISVWLPSRMEYKTGIYVCDTHRPLFREMHGIK